MAKTIAFVNGKGGVGKSTYCFLTALGLNQAGTPVVIEDNDEQLSVTGWVDGLKSKGLWQENQSSGDEITLVDSPPGAFELSRKIVSRADKIIIPCSPSPGEMAALPATLAVMNEAKRDNASIHVLLVKVDERTTLAAEAREVLEELQIPKLKIEIPASAPIQRSVRDGWKALGPMQEVIFRMTIEIMS